jgi:peptidoglycan/LPS O-acetylase OafA/YrhL
MYALNPLFALAVFLIAYATGYIINLKYKAPFSKSRYETIDGFRGFLALSVFIHHSNIWYQYIHLGHWESGKSNFYNQLGLSGVSFFFMITSFLFVSKLLQAKEKGFDWNAFFKSRVYRLTPMYLVATAIFYFIVMTLSHWKLRVGVFQFLLQLFRSCCFRILGGKTVNNLIVKGSIDAGVTWSLSYEWLFYFCLPLISIFILRRYPKKIYIAASLIFIFIYFLFNFNIAYQIQHYLSFIGGAIAPFLIRYVPKIKVNTLLANCVVVLCLVLIPLFYSPENIICKILLIIIFTAIALGNSFFGILKNPTLKLLGGISYSTYLLHGIILFVVIYWGVGIENAGKLPVYKYYLLILSITPLVVVISYLGFRFIEKPFIDKGKQKKGNFSGKHGAKGEL